MGDSDENQAGILRQIFLPTLPQIPETFFEGTRQVQGREVGKMGKNPQGCIY